MMGELRKKSQKLKFHFQIDLINRTLIKINWRCSDAKPMQHKLIWALCMVWQSWKTGDSFITVNYLGSFNSKWCLTTRKRKKSQKLRKSKNQDLESNLVQFVNRNYLPKEIFWKKLVAFSCKTKRIIFTFSACYLGKVLLNSAVIWTEPKWFFN